MFWLLYSVQYRPSLTVPTSHQMGGGAMTSNRWLRHNKYYTIASRTIRFAFQLTTIKSLLPSSGNEHRQAFHDTHAKCSPVNYHIITPRSGVNMRLPWKRRRQQRGGVMSFRSKGTRYPGRTKNARRQICPLSASVIPCARHGITRSDSGMVVA